MKPKNAILFIVVLCSLFSALPVIAEDDYIGDSNIIVDTVEVIQKEDGRISVSSKNMDVIRGFEGLTLFLKDREVILLPEDMVILSDSMFFRYEELEENTDFTYIYFFSLPKKSIKGLAFSAGYINIKFTG